jgi:hypothetical protein
MTETSDLLVFWGVVAARFFVPFTIPRYPLPGVLVSLVIDGIDQTIFQVYTELPLDRYQGYDKALDIYYLTITYVSTFRIWTNLFAFQMDRFFFFYRLGGVMLFELIAYRPLLMIFPNTFEYFFIFYEIVRVKWNPARLGRMHLLIAAALIWIVIKLPQEYIIHIAQVDTTEWFADHVSAPWNIVAPVAVLGLMVFGVVWFVRRLPATDWGFTFSADATLRMAGEVLEEDETVRRRPFFGLALLERAGLVVMVGIIFAQVLPDIKATGLEVAVGASFLVLISTILSQWLGQIGRGWEGTVREFLVMIAVNLGLVLVIVILLPSYEGQINLVNVIFFTLLFTIVVTLWDRYRVVHRMRFPKGSWRGLRAG